MDELKELQSEFLLAFPNTSTVIKTQPPPFIFRGPNAGSSHESLTEVKSLGMQIS